MKRLHLRRSHTTTALTNAADGFAFSDSASLSNRRALIVVIWLHWSQLIAADEHFSPSDSAPADEVAAGGPFVDDKWPFSQRVVLLIRKRLLRWACEFHDNCRGNGQLTSVVAVTLSSVAWSH